MTNLEHIKRLAGHGAHLANGTILTEEFYENAIRQCIQGGYNAITYELVLPGIEDEMAICIWADGHVDSGSMRTICDCLAAR